MINGVEGFLNLYVSGNFSKRLTLSKIVAMYYYFHFIT